VTFRIGGERYGLAARDIEAIASLPRFRELPHAPYYVLGLFEHRGELVPAIDLSALAGRGPSRSLMSTRVILVRFADASGSTHLLGLVAEQVTDTMAVTPAEAQPSPVRIQDAAYLGDLFAGEEGLLQVVKVEELLPPEVQVLLFPTERGEWTSAP
jgi:chemotaxis-related protein WspB